MTYEDVTPSTHPCLWGYSRKRVLIVAYSPDAGSKEGEGNASASVKT